MRRTATTFRAEENLGQVDANNIVSETLEDRHFADNEILPTKAAMLESAMAVPVVFSKAVTADATGGLSFFGTSGAPFKMRIVDVVVRCTTANGAGTLTLKNDTDSITDAIACATGDAVARAATIDDTFGVIASGDDLVVTANGAADKGIITVIGYKID